MFLCYDYEWVWLIVMYCENIFCFRMNWGEVYENFFYVVVLVVGCCILVLFKINEFNLKGYCLFFGEFDVLMNIVFVGNDRYCIFIFYLFLINGMLVVLLGFFKWCCSIDIDSLR